MKWFNQLSNYGSLLAGALLTALGLGSFLLPLHFIDGGVTGLSMLAARLTGLPLSVLLVLTNLPFVGLGYFQAGPRFALKSAMAITALVLAMTLIPFPLATSDKILGAIFGGFFVGIGVGLAIRGGGALDGTEILALLLSKRSFATVGEIILVLNAVIFAVAGIFLGVEPALYSALTYYAASRTIDYALHGIEAYNGVMIFSSSSETIRQSILSQLGRGVTVIRTVGGYTATEQDSLYCVVTRLELSRLEILITEADESAFMVVSPVLDVAGGTIKHRTFH